VNISGSLTDNLANGPWLRMSLAFLSSREITLTLA
jgi:hypothetical protein